MSNSELFNLIIQIDRVNLLKNAGYPASYEIVYNPNHPFEGMNIREIDVIFTVGEKQYSLRYYNNSPNHYNSQGVSLSSALNIMENKLIEDIKIRKLVESAKSKLTEDELVALKAELVK